MNITKLSDDLAFSDQPTFQALRQVRRLGFHVVVDVRMPGEESVPERSTAARAGLRHVTIPIAQRDWAEADFDRMARVLRDARGRRVLVHSAEGARAGVLALACLAGRSGWTVDRLVETGEALGLDVPEPARAFVRRTSGAYRPDQAEAPP
jgi:uncharacterized protein (TIGR01244 family)